MVLQHPVDAVDVVAARREREYHIQFARARMRLVHIAAAHIVHKDSMESANSNNLAGNKVLPMDSRIAVLGHLAVVPPAKYVFVGEGLGVLITEEWLCAILGTQFTKLAQKLKIGPSSSIRVVLL